MPFSIIRNDLTRMQADAIVNTANPKPVIGSGTDTAIYEAAGKDLLLKEREKIGDIERGDARITPGFHLAAKYIIHTVGPIWQGGTENEEEILVSCYKKSLLLAKEYGCQSIAFPLISTGNYGFPKDLALQLVLKTVSEFLLTEDMMIYLVVFDDASTKISERIFARIESHISREYVYQKRIEEYRSNDNRQDSNQWSSRRYLGGASFQLDEERYLPNTGYSAKEEEIKTSARSKRLRGFGFKPKMEKPKLKDLIGRKEETFQQMLLRLIEEKGLTNAQAYKNANQSKKLFSKIKNDVNYQPKKKTVLAFAIGLELNLDQTTDLLERAGYAFSPSNQFDIAIKYFVENEFYNIMEIECILFDLDLGTLCNYD